MIIFDLCCDQKHHFEGWFSSLEDFQQQEEKGLVSCPVCNSPRVQRVPSVLNIGSRSESSPAPEVRRKSPPSAPSPAPDAQQLLSLLTETLIRSAEDVGQDFAAEARRIHYQESPSRSIRGQATREEVQALQEEGVDVLRLPILDKEKLN